MRFLLADSARHACVAKALSKPSPGAATARRRPVNRCHGFTAPEVTIAAAIMVIVITAVVPLWMFAGRSFAAMTNYIDLDAKSRNALDLMIKEVRQAHALTYYTNSTIKLTGLNNEQLIYTWDRPSGELRRSVNGVQDRRSLLTGCEML